MIVSSISSITPSPGARGLNALLATVSSTGSAPVVVAQRLRKGSCGSPRGAKRLVADVLTAIASLSNGAVLVRADPAAYGQPTVAAALRAGASVTLEILPSGRDGFLQRHLRWRTTAVPLQGMPGPSGGYIIHLHENTIDHPRP